MVNEFPKDQKDNSTQPGASNDTGSQQGAGNTHLGTADENNYQNIETAVNNRSYFGDDYEVEQEEEISGADAETEDENNVPKTRRGSDQ